MEQHEAPKLSDEKKIRKEKPLDYLVKGAALDPNTKWRRLYPLGSNAELFVVVRQETKGKSFEVILTTDAGFPLILHWGIARPGVLPMMFNTSNLKMQHLCLLARSMSPLEC